MTQYEQAAIIGYFRMGASWEWIAETMGISIYFAKAIVKHYLKLHPNQS